MLRAHALLSLLKPPGESWGTANPGFTGRCPHSRDRRPVTIKKARPREVRAVSGCAGCSPGATVSVWPHCRHSLYESSDNARLERVRPELPSTLEHNINHQLLAAGTKGIQVFWDTFRCHPLPRNASLVLEGLPLVAMRDQTMTTPLGDR